MTTTVRWHAVADLADLARQANTQILAIAEEAIAERGHFSIVLAGGDTPRPIYRRLRGAFTDWKRWDIYFGDERCLPADDSWRNSHMASSEWLDHVALAPSRIHRIAAEHGAQAAAAAYAQTLSSVGAFDMVLLGLGEDGHTASLFPGHDLGLGPDAPDVLAVHDAPKPPPERISLSAARLGRARRVLFLVAGSSKRQAVADWRAGVPIPASTIASSGGVDVLVEASLL